MEQANVNTLTKGSPFDGYLLVRSADRRQGKNGKYYLDLNLADRTGEINAKYWNEEHPLPEVGSIQQVKGSVEEFNGRLQLRVGNIKHVEQPGNELWALLVPCAPEPPEAMLERIYKAVKEIKSEPLRKITEEALRVYRDKLMYYPAAQRIHHAEKSGLLHHTVGMLNTAARIIRVYPFLNADLICAGVILHDLCKIDEMDSNELGIVRDYSQKGLLLGHITLGVNMVGEIARRLEIEGEPVLLLQHMLLSHHENPEWGSPRMPMFPEAEVLHWLDILDARMNELKSIEEKLQPGVFSERIGSLERRIYKPNYEALYTKTEPAYAVIRDAEQQTFLP